MEQITQLKQMRDDALSRLQYNTDYKLLVSLDRLIREIEQLVLANSTQKPLGSALPMFQKETTAPQIVSDASADKETSDEIDKAFDKIADDLKNEVEAANLDGGNSALKSVAAKSGTVKSETKISNGAFK